MRDLTQKKKKTKKMREVCSYTSIFRLKRKFKAFNFLISD